MATKFYHGSAKPIEPGTVMTGRGERYESEWTDTDFFWALEIHRPADCLPHREAVFLVDNVEDIDNAGGCTDWCLEVEPGERISRHDLNWSSEISCLVGDGHGLYSDEVKAAAAKYWSGESSGDSCVWEYLTDRATVVSCEALDADPDFAP